MGFSFSYGQLHRLPERTPIPSPHHLGFTKNGVTTSLMYLSEFRGAEK
jgi:hypothetical protein